MLFRSLLLEHFNGRLASRINGERLIFGDEVLEALLAYPWPGNVRELRNLVEKLHLLSNGSDITLRDLPAEMRQTGRRDAVGLPALGRRVEDGAFTLEEAEGEAIRNVLAAEGGNLSRAARRLGISRPTLYRKLEQHGIRRGFV